MVFKFVVVYFSAYVLCIFKDQFPFFKSVLNQLIQFINSRFLQTMLDKWRGYFPQLVFLAHKSLFEFPQILIPGWAGVKG